MPTTIRFDANILAASRRVQQIRVDPTSNGDGVFTFKSVDWQNYQNRAIRDIITQSYASLKFRFGDIIPQYVVESTPKSVSAGSVVMPSD
ncbi:MAG TPA: hypothetical protein VKI62_09215, partial [Bacteroidota bacterium]|nr:hypothetical protein [Bacteroidota bacterium]